MSDAYTYTTDSRLRRCVRLDVQYGDQEAAYSLDEPTEVQALDALHAFERLAGTLLTRGAS